MDYRRSYLDPPVGSRLGKVKVRPRRGAVIPVSGEADLHSSGVYGVDRGFGLLFVRGFSWTEVVILGKSVSRELI